MKNYHFNIVHPVSGVRASILVKELTQSLALKEANKKAKKLGYILIY